MSAFIIAEAGVNHNGSIELAKKLINAAADAGADAVKFQTFNAKDLVSEQAPKAPYQKKSTGQKESQYEMLKHLELSETDHRELIDHCLKKGIQFLSTPFDFESVDLLSSFSLPLLKISSGDITNAPLLLKMARTQNRIILSTGMSTLEDIKQALGVLAFGFLNPTGTPGPDAFENAFTSEQGQHVLKNKVTVLHCTTEYPTPFTEVNLKAMDTLRETFHLPVGLSDHSAGINIPIAAVARGAAVLEKHFTMDRTLPGPDHQASLEPGELAEMVQAIREVEQALGSSLKSATSSEQKNIHIARKSLVAEEPIKKGDLFSENNLSIKRPGTGLSPFKYWSLLGTKADKPYEKDEVIR